MAAKVTMIPSARYRTHELKVTAISNTRAATDWDMQAPRGYCGRNQPRSGHHWQTTNLRLRCRKRCGHVARHVTRGQPQFLQLFHSRHNALRHRHQIRLCSRPRDVSRDVASDRPEGSTLPHSDPGRRQTLSHSATREPPSPRSNNRQGPGGTTPALATAGFHVAGDKLYAFTTDRAAHAIQIKEANKP